VTGAVDAHVVLGVRRGADSAEIHAAYRAAVRRTHPDAGGTAAEFEAVQEAYEALRDAPRRPAADRQAPPRRATSSASGLGADRPPRRARPTGSASEAAGSSAGIDALLAESRRLEDEARRLAGLPPRHETAAAAGVQTGDSVSAILRDATGQLRDATGQLREAAGAGARELRRRVRRML
jgi:curved DNA-binding protein CbpA